MSFRLFIFYSAVGGGCGAYVGWMFSQMLVGGTGSGAAAQAAVRGLFLGILVAVGLALVDVIGNLTFRNRAQAGTHVGVAAVVGGMAGVIGGVIGHVLYSSTDFFLFLILGWTVTGVLIGVSLGAYDLLSRLILEEDVRGASRKVRNGVLGGAVGGVAGSVLFLLFRSLWGLIFSGKPLESLWSPTATGFVALGVCLGLFIGLVQVILKEAWVRVEAGFRPGREILLFKPSIAIGRAEECDIGLFGDAAADLTHAHIRNEGNRYLLIDNGSANGTYLNDERITQPTPLKTGDIIRLGNSVLSFGERRKAV